VHTQYHALSVTVKAGLLTALSRHCLLSEDDRHLPLSLWQHQH